MNEITLSFIHEYHEPCVQYAYEAMLFYERYKNELDLILPDAAIKEHDYQYLESTGKLFDWVDCFRHCMTGYNKRMVQAWGLGSPHQMMSPYEVDYIFSKELFKSYVAGCFKVSISDMYRHIRAVKRQMCVLINDGLRLPYYEISSDGFIDFYE